MANPQHLEWLKEGVAAWNARRMRKGFVPNLAGADLRKADLRKANLWGADLRAADLREAKLQGANLRDAMLQRADLLGANLLGAKLQLADLLRADLRQANLWGAKLQGAKLQGADLRGADLWRADVRAVLMTNASTKEMSAPEHTDLSDSLNLTQQNLDEMDGDSGTILPEGLTRPDHWPDWRDQLKENATSSETDIEEDSPSQEASRVADGSLIAQRDLLFSTRIESAAAAKLFNEQLDMAISLYRAANPSNQPPDDLILLERYSDKIREIRAALEQDEPKDVAGDKLSDLLAIIEDLKATIDAQRKEIETLKAQKPERTDFQKCKSAFAVTFGTALGTGTAGIVLASGDALLGSYGASALQGLKDAFTGFFTAVPPAPPPPNLPPSFGA